MKALKFDPRFKFADDTTKKAKPSSVSKKVRNYRREAFDKNNKIIRGALIKERGQRCEKCNRDIPLKKLLTLHHIVPMSYGGTDDPNNLMLLCRRCHIEEDKISLNKYREESYMVNGLRITCTKR